MFQNNALIDNLSIKDNLLLALKYANIPKSKIMKVIEDSLKLVKLEIDINTKIYQLSGGEQQRVAIARAIIKPSKIILADEPTGNLDVENRNIIINLFKLINKKLNKTIVIVTHDLELAKIGNLQINL